jgi:hypothetical protein
MIARTDKMGSLLEIMSKTANARLPSSIKVGPITYAVIVVSRPLASRREEDKVPVFGMVNFKTAIVTIDADLTPSMQWQCFFHELFHIFYVTLGLKEPGEGPIDAMAYLLMEFLIDNGFLVEEFPALESIKPTFTSLPFFPRREQLDNRVNPD